MADFREFTEQVKLANDIVEVIGEHVELKKAGKNYVACCPFHQEKTPSFSVSPSKQFFHCYGCKAGGDVIDFVCRTESLDFKEAVAVLAGRQGIPVPELGRGESPERRREREDRKLALYELHELAQGLYREQFRQSAEAQRYCEARGLSAEAIERFGLGWAPQGWRNLSDLARQRGYSEEALTESGLVVRSEKKTDVLYDRFRERLTFPIHDARKRIIGFGGRVLVKDPEAAKYINSPESPIYHKGGTLYGLHLARPAIQQAGRALICEGNLDLIALHQFGFAHSVANLGTAFTADQGRLLRRLCQEVVLLYDGDEAGQKAMLRVSEVLLPLDFAIRVVTFGADDDPDTFLHREGAAGLERLLEGARDQLDFFLESAARQFDARRPEGKEAIVEFMSGLLDKIPGPIVAQDARRRIAEFLGLDEATLNAALARRRRRQPTGIKEAVVRDEGGAPPFEEELLRRMVGDAGVRKFVSDELNSELISHEWARYWIEEVIHLTQQGHEVSIQTLLSQEPPGGQEAVAFLRAVLMEEVVPVEDDARLGREILLRVERDHRERQALPLHRQLARSERERDEDLTPLKAELKESWCSKKVTQAAIDKLYPPNQPAGSKKRRAG